MLKTIFLNFSILLMSSFGGTTISDKSDIEDIRNKADFHIYVPSNVESATNYEIKEPSDIKQKKDVQMVLINYFNEEGSYVFGVRQLKNDSYITKEITEYDVRNKTQNTRKVEQKFTFKPRGELISVNGVDAWYEAYVGKNATGSMLRWIESDTFIELDTSQLSRASLIKIAESMKKI